MLKKGNKVVMHTCGESEHYKGKVWTCKSDEFTSSAKQQVVFLEGFSGYFLADYLQFIDLTEYKKTKGEQRYVRLDPLVYPEVTIKCGCSFIDGTVVHMCEEHETDMHR